MVFGEEVLVREPGRRLSPEESLSTYPKETQTQARSKRNGNRKLPCGYTRRRWVYRLSGLELDRVFLTKEYPGPRCS